jgi:hypothetical protein
VDKSLPPFGGFNLGEVCRPCGKPIGWPEPVGIMFADGATAHRACYERAELEPIRRRAKNTRSLEALTDAAELCLRGELE